MAHSGRYKVVNRDKYAGDPANIVYRSSWERKVFKWCDHNIEVKSWESEETVIPYFYDVDKRYHRYFVDLKITWRNNKTTLIEIKPEKETQPPSGERRTKKYIYEGLTYVKNMNKWKAAKEYAEDRGWTFEVWTEKKLQEMKLLVKPMPGKIKKPLKKAAPYRKKKISKPRVIPPKNVNAAPKEWKD